MLKKIFIFVLFGLTVTPHALYAQSKSFTYTEDFQKAKVIKVLESGAASIAGTDTMAQTQSILVEVATGKDMGKTVTIDNDYIQLKEGDMFFVRHQFNAEDNSEYWSVADPYRLDILFWLTMTFVLLIFIFGGLQGVRGFASLLGSLFLIFYLLIPGIYAGYNAVVISIGVASLIIIVGSYITHGFNKTTTAAVIGMIGTVIVTGLAAYFAVDMSSLAGHSSEESTYLTLETKGAISMVGLLFGGIMIGLLGVLYDVAISQSVAVEELCRAGKHMTRREVYKRAIRMGKEHIGALVNTLAIAYVGASLPLLLLIQKSTVNPLVILNSEIFATEIVRILIGGIGLILAVPVTTLIASYMLHGKVSTVSSENARHFH